MAFRVRWALLTNGLGVPVDSKLKLYECLCGVKVRGGRSRSNAQCLDCGGLFELPVAARPSSTPTAP